MAVNPISQVQSAYRLMKPSRDAFESPFWRCGDMKRELQVWNTQGGLMVGFWTAPWPGVIEEIMTVQQVAGGGVGGQNRIDVLINGASVFLAAADGNTVLDNDAAQTSARTFPTSLLLVTCNDGVQRVRFNMGDVISMTATPAIASYGTARTRIMISREFPAAV